MKAVRRWEKNEKVQLIGTEYEIEETLYVLNRTPGLESVTEPVFRTKVQYLIDRYRLLAVILYDGNTVWGRDGLMRDFRRVVAQNATCTMSNNLYKFFSLCIGTIAHYDRLGWAERYPDTESLRKLFACNEMGERVRDYVPEWKTDVKSIVVAMEGVLDIPHII